MRDRRVLFIQHGESDKPGLLADVLLARGIPLDVLRPDLGQRVPETLDGFSGLALGGGAQGAYETDKHPYLADEIRLVRHAAAGEKPVLGLCLGAQLMAAALGAEVRPAGFFEIGFHPVELGPIAELDPLWTGLPREFHPTHWHGDVFEIPPGGMLMGRSRLTPHQAFRYGAHLYGFQFHLEMTLEIFEEMVKESQEELAGRGCEPGQLLLHARQHLPPLQPVAETVFSRWADFL
ncbi:MAG: gamma-glutamyl-gamma-aminobutyrate hydrolase family protein [Terrimicrobiaceae bacterium]|nr:gamma-glutamyl-gamma-aminobutyrate hydrolase family protein [Terrimicrobiaceae bacterium]